MMSVPFVKSLVGAGSIDAFLADVLHVEPNDVDRSKVAQKLIRLRYRYDFPFWAAMLCWIHNKDAGVDVLFRLRYPQRILVERFERKRREGKPIRLILLKARQWGGSTTTQLYMAWLQFIHRKGLNSLIIAHQGSGSDEIKDMFDTMIKAYPVELLHKMGESYHPMSLNLSESESPAPPRAFLSAVARLRLALPRGPMVAVAVHTPSSISPRSAFGKRPMASLPKILSAPLAPAFCCVRSL